MRKTNSRLNLLTKLHNNLFRVFFERNDRYRSFVIFYDSKPFLTHLILYVKKVWSYFWIFWKEKLCVFKFFVNHIALRNINNHRSWSFSSFENILKLLFEILNYFIFSFQIVSLFVIRIFFNWKSFSVFLQS